MQVEIPNQNLKYIRNEISNNEVTIFEDNKVTHQNDSSPIISSLCKIYNILISSYFNFEQEKINIFKLFLNTNSNLFY